MAKKPKYKIEFSKETCIGCESCTQCDNWGFDNKEYKAFPKKTELDDLGGNQEAADNCPVGAIKVKKVK